jgi:hypothetical protein
MKNKILSFFAAGCLLVLLAGCVNTVDGHRQGGWPMAKDRIESTYERPASQIVAAAIEVLKYNGVLTAHNTVNNSLVAKVDTRTVFVRIEQMDASVTKVITQVRTKGGAANIALASEIDKQIGMRLVTMPR